MRARRHREQRHREQPLNAASDVFRKGARRQGWIYLGLSVFAVVLLVISAGLLWATVALWKSQDGGGSGGLLACGILGVFGIAVWFRALRPRVLLARRIQCPGCGGDARLECDESTEPHRYELVCGGCGQRATTGVTDRTGVSD